MMPAVRTGSLLLALSAALLPAHARLLPLDAAFLLSRATATSGNTLRAWRWQRSIKPAGQDPAAAQCTVLDAGMYTLAAPGLRDVRLVQDGRELAYALEESYDTAALENARAARAGSDRSLYTTVLRIPLSRGGDGAYRGAATLPKHVPVERMALEPLTASGHAGEYLVSNAQPEAQIVHFRLTATPLPFLGTPEGETHSELIEADLRGSQPVEQTALGANLQEDATVNVVVSGGSSTSAALLQMHQRSICYQPLSQTAPMLYFGNPTARPVHYSYSAHLLPSAAPLTATLEPMQSNPAFQLPTQHHSSISRQQRLLLALFVAVAAFLLTAVPLLRRFA